MKKYIYKKVMAVTVLLFAAVSAAQAQDRQLLVLHTNDTHSCILPLKETLADTAIAGRGGYLRRINLVKEERAKDPDLLLFDSGDFSQGSPFYNIYQGEVEVDLMNRMGYDAVTIGNHEFDFFLDNMARLFRRAQFPIVCSNYDFTGTPCEGLVKPYIILKRKGVKIGVLALAPQLKGLVDDKNCEGVKFLDPVKVGNEVAARLKQVEKCDIVICLSHLGWTAEKYGDKTVMAQTRNIDLFLGGHSHTYLDNLEYVKNLDGRLIGNDQNGKHGIWIGRLVLDLKKK